MAHLAGNLLIFSGKAAFNQYAHTLQEFPLLPVLQVALACVFVAHVAVATRVSIDNRKAQGPRPFTLPKHISQWAPRSMILTGIIVGAFLVWHILGLKFGAYYETSLKGVPMRDLYRLVVEYFQYGPHVAGYLVAMVAMGLHVSHGFWSAFQSLGVYAPCLRGWSYGLAWALAGGFSSVPLAIYFGGVGP